MGEVQVLDGLPCCGGVGRYDNPYVFQSGPFYPTLDVQLAAPVIGEKLPPVDLNAFRAQQEAMRKPIPITAILLGAGLAYLIFR